MRTALLFRQTARRPFLPRQQVKSLSTRAVTVPSSQRLAVFTVTSAAASIVLASQLISPVKTYNHCQVPCGIFDDPAMVGEVKQHCSTIRKAMVESAKHHATGSPLGMNQMVRWINTKEDHCNKIISLMGDYCLCQRVKRALFSTEQEYLDALKMHHVVMQAAMKAKQTMDVAACDALEHAVADFAKMYTK